MKQKLFLITIILLTQFVVSLKVNAGNMVVNKGTITIYVGEEKTMYHSIPYEYYVNANSWFLRDTSGSAWSDGQEKCGAKIVSKNSESCTIKGMWDNVGALAWCELHCKGTKSNGEYYECYWKVIVKSRGNIFVDASPAAGVWNNPTMVEAGTKVYLTARTSDGSSASDAQIYYRTDGEYATVNSTPYTSAGITITKKTYLSAIASKSGYSPVTMGGYYDVIKDIKVTSITLNKTSLSLQPEEVETLTATVLPSNATDKTVTWSSSNNSVATVDNNGKVKAVATGSATITCTANDGSGVKATCAITVNKPTGIDINATNFPDANFRNYLLSQSYGQDGVLTDKEIQGITYISVTSENISSLKGIEFFTALKELWCYVNQLTSLDVSKNTELTKLICYANQLTSLDVSKNTALTALDCQSNPLKSLDVSKNAALEDLNCGSTQLTSLDVTKNTALKELYCYNNQLTSLDVSKNTALINLWCYTNQIKGTAMDNLISGLPKNTTGDQHKFNVVAPTRDTEGNVCTKAQVAAVKAKGWFPCYYDSNTKEYVEYEGSEEVKPIKIVLPSTATVVADEKITLTPEITPENAEYTLTWSSDDETVATVDANGVVTGKKKGQTYINVETDNGLTGWCKLTVTNPAPTAIALSKKETVYVGEAITLTPEITPANAETTLTWTSDDPTIATVADGVVTGVSEGLTVIYVTTDNGLRSKPCKLTVTPDPSGINDLQADNNSAPVYTLSGQRLAAPRKGVNIVGGRKVVVK